MNIKEMCEEAYENSKAHGWWEGEFNLPEKIALMHSELSEALEDYRKVGLKGIEYVTVDRNPDSAVVGKPEGFLTELADVIIRIGDLCGHLGCSQALEDVIRMKMDYNKTRPYRHGGKKC